MDGSTQPPKLPPRPMGMRVRQWLNRHGSAATGAAVMIAVVGLAVAVALSPKSSNNPPNHVSMPGQAWFYDTVTGAYFVDTATRVPPIISPAGNPAVRAHFFTCGDCDDASRFLGYYEKYNPNAKRRIENNPQQFEFYEEAFKGRLYSTDAKKWVPAESDAGLAIVDKLQHHCPAKKLRYCPPTLHDEQAAGATTTASTSADHS